MTTATFSAAPTNATDAEFRAWGSALSAALATVGMVKTADTGQINWTTVVKPGGANTFQGYEIWRFNDTLQSTKPLFLKIEYGAGTISTSRPALRFQVGKGTDGAGTLSGTFGAALSVLATNFNSTPANCYVSSGDGSLLAVALWPTVSSVPINFFVDRSRDTAGAATDWAVTMCAGTSTGLSTYVYSSATVFQNVVPMGPFGSSQPSTTSGGVAPMIPPLCMDGQGHYWQPRAVLQYNAPDAAMAVPVTVAGWGTYLPAWTNFANSGFPGINGAIAWS